MRQTKNMCSKTKFYRYAVVAVYVNSSLCQTLVIMADFTTSDR